MFASFILKFMEPLHLVLPLVSTSLDCQMRLMNPSNSILACVLESISKENIGPVLFASREVRDSYEIL